MIFKALIELTSDSDATRILVDIAQIAAIHEQNDHTGILLSNGVEFNVTETYTVVTLRMQEILRFHTDSTWS